MSEREIVDRVRERYGSIAEGKSCGCCGSESDVSIAIGYAEDDLTAVPEEANLGLGCGAPIAFLELAPGETVLDLGSGAGLDCLLAARAVGPRGTVLGVDMTPAMIERARANVAKAGVANVEFREGLLDALPVADGSVDAVTSNCVINLVPDKSAVFREVARVLRPGGRMVVSDIMLDGELPRGARESLLAWVGCVAGAMRREPYFDVVEAAGLERPEVLRDVDYLGATGFDKIPSDLRDDLIAAGVVLSDLAGIVHSVTYRTRRPR
jgi:SAM-dependent methyltransferase